MEKLQKLYTLIKKLIENEFYGEIIVKVEKGDIVHCMVNKSIKL